MVICLPGEDITYAAIRGVLESLGMNTPHS